MPRSLALFEDALPRLDQAGAAVLLSQRGHPLQRRARGCADVRTGDRLRPETLFRVGSVAKLLTACVLLRQVARGELCLEDRLPALVRPCPPHWRDITLEMLLAHRSGLSSVLEEPAGGSPPHRERLARLPLQFAPGTGFAYSNRGFVLLADVLEVHSGVPFAELLAREVLRPLGLRRTFVETGLPPPPEQAVGHAWDDRQEDCRATPEPPFARFEDATGAGNLVSCLDDLHRFIVGVAEEEFLPRALRESMERDRGHGYGLGCRIWHHAGDRLLGHSGLLPGFGSLVAALPDRSLTVVALANSWGAPWGADALGLELAYRTLGCGRFGRRLPRRVLEPLVGRYALWGDAVLTVSIDSGQLTIAGPGQPAYPVEALDPTTFVLRAAERTLRFELSEAGVALHARLDHDRGPRVT